MFVPLLTLIFLLIISAGVLHAIFDSQVALSLGLSSESGGAKLGRAMSGTAIDYRVVIKRDPPEHWGSF